MREQKCVWLCVCERERERPLWRKVANTAKTGLFAPILFVVEKELFFLRTSSWHNVYLAFLGRRIYCLVYIYGCCCSFLRQWIPRQVQLTKNRVQDNSMTMSSPRQGSITTRQKEKGAKTNNKFRTFFLNSTFRHHAKKRV